MKNALKKQRAVLDLFQIHVTTVEELASRVSIVECTKSSPRAVLSPKLIMAVLTSLQRSRMRVITRAAYGGSES